MFFVSSNDALVYFFLLMIMSCGTPETSDPLEKEEGAISSMLIDQMAISFPPPPPPEVGGEGKKMNIDSLNQVKVEVVVDTLMFEISTEVDLDNAFSKYQDLVEKIQTLSEKPIDTGHVSSKKGHHLIYGNNLKDSGAKYPQLISVSRMAFNEELNRAAVFAGKSTGRLSGYLNLYLLEKIEGRWKIVFKKNIEVS